ncbi:MAG: transporter substrate-binding domain-containing protein [Proteiniphilum sp.]|nr:transporter substrate-binding domain-containing protein [Proteiniphilum sp.]MDD2726559.1 transporter substrate-binding domain-containing protein [Proteiniphilum sp.]MDD3555411.1 transporter substrate-binding domain-containing protein [Proteiniphilum sp.]MDD3979780.1 transporter substrate-binding domain-containing protein [Proteiniphilum sp.]MDD4485578.1 transporter substrate-binding domain-containing protein [Proteiniphilum sp.]
MKLQKRLQLYLVLLVVAGGAMIMLYHLIGRQTQTPLVRDYSEILASGEMNVVTDYNSIGYYVSGDTAAGFQLEMMRALEQEWGIKVNIYLENSLDANLQGLLEQQYDLVARSIPVNMALRDSFAFTDPITYNRLVLVQRKALFNEGEEPVRQHLELASRQIHVAAGSQAIMRLNNLSREIGDTILIHEDPLYETEQLVMMVASGDIDYTVCDKQMALRLSEVLPEIDIETELSFTQLESWALRRDAPRLLDSLNSWLNRFRETKQFNQIYRNYYEKE